jgi:Flp pilus assembly protein TadG
MAPIKLEFRAPTRPEPARAGDPRVPVRESRIRPGDRGHGRNRGQSVVEFALVLVPLLLLLLGAIQFGVIWASQVGVTNAVRDAARAASGVQPKSNSAGDVTQAREQSYAGSINTTVLMPALAGNVPFYSPAAAQKQVCYSTFTDAAGNPRLQSTVTVIYAHPIFLPLISDVLGNAISTTASLSIPVGLDLPYTLPPVGAPAGCSS